ncbi:MAG: GrpB family protein [Acidobacteriota bacterium]
MPEPDLPSVPGSRDRLQEALRISRTIRELEARVQDDREPIARKVRRWQRLRTPQIPDWAQELRPHDPAWEERFDREAGRIRGALGPVVEDVQHIGSSSISHLPSKPMLDLAVAVRDDPASPRLVEAFTAIGYEHFGNSPCDHEADWYWKTGADLVMVVHLCHAENPWRTTAVNFRDYLRVHPEESELYERRKRELKAGEAGSLLEYSLGKLALFYEISARADEWRAAAGPNQPISAATTPGNPST